MKTRTYRSVRHAVVVAVVRALVITAALAIGYGATSLADSGPRIVYPNATAPERAPEPATDATAQAITAHGCWTGKAPAKYASTIPGHVVTQHGYQGAHAVDLAFGQLFSGEDHSLTVYAFCP